MKKAILILSVLSAFVLSASDAEAKRRYRPKPKPQKIVSVFDTENWQKPVLLPGLVSVYQAYTASQYVWKPEEVWRFPKAEQELKTYHKAEDKPLSSLMWASLGVIMGSMVGILSLALALSRA